MSINLVPKENDGENTRKEDGGENTKILRALVDQQGQILSMLATVIGQTSKPKVPVNHPGSYPTSSHQQPLPVTEKTPTLSVSDHFFLEDLPAENEKTVN